MNIENSSLHSITSPPRSITLRWPSMVKFLFKTGSMRGSMYSTQLSKRKGSPNWMACSRNFWKSSLKVFTLRTSPSFALSQDTACSCGSMQSGNREARVVRMPFCTESSSPGSPWAFQDPISTSSVRNLLTLKFSVILIFLSRISVSQLSYNMVSRKSKVKAPV